MLSPNRESNLVKLAKHSRAAAVLTSLGAVLLAATLGYSAHKLNTLETGLTDLDARKQQLENEIATLQGRLRTAQVTLQRAEGLETACDDLRAALLSRETLSQEARSLVERASRAKYLIRLYGTPVQVNEIASIGSTLKGEGYTVEFLRDWGRHPGWPLMERKVVYHSQRTENVARAVAELLAKETGKPFAVVLSSDSDAPPNQQDWILDVETGLL